MKKLILPAIAASLLHVGVSHAEEQGIPADNIGATIDFLQTEFPNLSDEEALGAVNGELNGKINELVECAKELDGFAGVHIDYAPKLRAIVKFTRNPNSKLRQCTSDSVFQSRGAASSLEELVFVEGVAQELLADLEVPHGITLDVIKNRVTVEVEPENFKSARKAINASSRENPILRSAIKLRKGDGFFTSSIADDVIEVQGNIPAGRACTTGYNVEQISTGLRGVTTAGHCRLSSFGVGGGFFSPNTQRVQASLDWTLTPAAANNDLAWYSNANDIYLNRISYTNVVPGTFLAVNGTLNSNLLNTSSLVCRLGRTSNDEQCGFYVGRVTRTEATFLTSSNFALARQTSSTSTTSFVQEGDSGGPVYMWSSLLPGAVTAVGTVVARGRNTNGELLFNEVEKFSNLGIRIITN